MSIAAGISSLRATLRMDLAKRSIERVTSRIVRAIVSLARATVSILRVGSMSIRKPSRHGAAMFTTFRIGGTLFRASSRSLRTF